MMIKSLSSGAILAALQLGSGALAQGIPASLAEFCAAQPNQVVQIFVTEQLVEFDIGINTFINENTNLVINSNNVNNFIENTVNNNNTNINVNPITINITNAPTQIVTNILGSSTATVTSTVTTTETAATADPTATAAGETFLLNVADAGVVRRQATDEEDNIDGKVYVAANGRTTRDCRRASRFQIINNELLQEGSRFSIAPQSRSSIFAASFSGNITTSFSLNNGQLTWANPDFEGGFAFFCRIPFGQLQSVFRGDGPNCQGRVFFLANTPQSCVSNSSSTSLSSTTESTSSTTNSTTSPTASPTGNGTVTDLPTSELPTTTSLPTTTDATSTSSDVTSTSSSSITDGTSTTSDGGTSTSSSSTTAGPSGTTAPFALQAALGPAARKRQLFGGFLDGNGVLTQDATLAAEFQIITGELLQNSVVVSTEPGVANRPFSPQLPIGSITTLWSISTSSIEWTNGNFSTVIATYCAQTADNQVNIIFDGILPAGCEPILLQPVAPGTNASSSSVSSTTELPTSTTNTANIIDTPAQPSLMARKLRARATVF